MFERLDLLTKELTILAKEDAKGFQQIITSLEDLTVYGKGHSTCGYGKYYQGEWNKAKERADEMLVSLRIDEDDLTPMEEALWECEIDKPLNEDQQAFLALCKEIQQLCSPQATGSKG